MDKFFGRDKVNGLSAQLESASDPRERSRITKQMVKEEDKLGADHESLARINKHIRTGSELIAWQQVRLRVCSDYDRAEAKTLLEHLMESQGLLQRCHKRILNSIRRKNL
jgi:hypothetical protein